MSVEDQIPKHVRPWSISSWNMTDQAPGVASQLVSPEEAANVDEAEASTELGDGDLAVTGTPQQTPSLLNLNANVMMMREAVKRVREGWVGRPCASGGSHR